MMATLWRCTAFSQNLKLNVTFPAMSVIQNYATNVFLKPEQIQHSMTKYILKSFLVQTNRKATAVEKLCYSSHHSTFQHLKIKWKHSIFENPFQLKDFNTCITSGSSIRGIHSRFHSQRRFYSQGFRPLDPNQQSRRNKLLFFTYLSCFIGVCLLGAIGFQYYGRMAKRAQGMEEVKLREYGRRAVLFRYRGFILPSFVAEDVRNIHPFEVREDDVWVVSFPKAGTTWLQEIVYLITTDLDFKGAAQTTIDQRCPYFEFPVPGKEAIKSMPSPRLIKTHLPFTLLPNQIKEKKPKIIYIMRNPKDTAVSFYHFAVKFFAPINKFESSFERYCELFAEDLVPYGPWWKHVLDAWKSQNEDNVLILSYEDLQKDVCKEIHKIASFLGKHLSESQVKSIAAHCSFDQMKDNQTVNYDWMKQQGIAQEGVGFMRKGKVGDWKNHLSAEIAAKLDDMVTSRLTPEGILIEDTLYDGPD